MDHGRSERLEMMHSRLAHEARIERLQEALSRPAQRPPGPKSHESTNSFTGGKYSVNVPRKYQEAVE